MNENSLTAHSNNLQEGSYQTMKERILEKLSEVGQARMQHIALMLGVQEHVISGRFGEMVKSERIEIVEKVKIGKNNYSIYKVKTAI